MDSTLIKAKAKAFLSHAIITVIVVFCSAVLVFQLWYPDGYSAMVGGRELYVLLITIECILGPAMSLVIFNPAKHRRELIRDYLIVGAIQLGALIYGLSIVAEARPVYLVFVKDRFEVVAAVELDKVDVDQGAPGFNRLGWAGPQRVCAKSPDSADEKNNLIFSAIFAGRDIHLFPKYYIACGPVEWMGQAYPGERLRKIMAAKRLEVELAEDNFTWLPVSHRFGSWVEIYPQGRVKNAYFLPIDPFER